MLYNPNWKETEQSVELDGISQGLLRAANYIEKHGWCQNRLLDVNGRVCLYGAIKHSNIIWGHVNKAAAFDRVAHVLLDDPINWNDAKGRTKDEVVSVLKQAAYSKQSDK